MHFSIYCYASPQELEEMRAAQRNGSAWQMDLGLREEGYAR